MISKVSHAGRCRTPRSGTLRVIRPIVMLLIDPTPLQVEPTLLDTGRFPVSFRPQALHQLNHDINLRHVSHGDQYAASNVWMSWVATVRCRSVPGYRVGHIVDLVESSGHALSLSAMCSQNPSACPSSCVLFDQ